MRLLHPFLFGSPNNRPSKQWRESIFRSPKERRNNEKEREVRRARKEARKEGREEGRKEGEGRGRKEAGKQGSKEARKEGRKEGRKKGVRMRTSWFQAEVTGFLQARIAFSNAWADSHCPAKKHNEVAPGLISQAYLRFEMMCCCALFQCYHSTSSLLFLSSTSSRTGSPEPNSLKHFFRLSLCVCVCMQVSYTRVSIAQ